MKTKVIVLDNKRYLVYYTDGKDVPYQVHIERSPNVFEKMTNNEIQQYVGLVYDLTLGGKMHHLPSMN